MFHGRADDEVRVLDLQRPVCDAAWNLLLFRRLHHDGELGSLGGELLRAGFAAEIHVGSFVGDFDGLAHGAEVFIGDDALFERVGGGHACISGGEDSCAEEQAGEWSQRFREARKEVSE